MMGVGVGVGVGVVQTQQAQSLSSMCCSCTNQYQNQKQSKVVKVGFCFSRHSSIIMSSVTNVRSRPRSRRRTSFAPRSSSSNDSSSTSTPESNEKEEVDSNNNNSNRKGPDLKTLVRRFWKVAAPYWYCEEDKVQARWQLAAVFALTLGTTGISVGFNFLGRDFYNALASTFTTTF